MTPPDFGPKKSSVRTEKCYLNVYKPRASSEITMTIPGF